MTVWQASWQGPPGWQYTWRELLAALCRPGKFEEASVEGRGLLTVLWAWSVGLGPSAAAPERGECRGAAARGALPRADVDGGSCRPCRRLNVTLLRWAEDWALPSLPSLRLWETAWPSTMLLMIDLPPLCPAPGKTWVLGGAASSLSSQIGARGKGSSASRGQKGRARRRRWGEASPALGAFRP